MGEDIGYTGHVQDGGGLVYAQQRYYDPVIGRFMSTDPVMPNAGDMRYFGRYHYRANNPYRYTDLSGMTCGDPNVDDDWGAVDWGEVTESAERGGDGYDWGSRLSVQDSLAKEALNILDNRGLGRVANGLLGAAGVEDKHEFGLDDGSTSSSNKK